MSDTLTIPERQETYWQKKAELAKQNDAKIKQFMEAILVELQRRYPAFKMEWREREKQEDLVPWRSPELVLRILLEWADWYFAINERDILTADNYDEFLADNVARLIALIGRELERNI